MNVLAEIALKSLLVSLLALLAMAATRKSTAALRSWIVHAGMVVLLLLPLSGWLLPSFEIPMLPEIAAAPSANTPSAETSMAAALSGSADVAAIVGGGTTSSWHWPVFAWVMPGAIILAFTVLALLRLFALRGRARIVTEPRWLGALAQAQARMDRKHGTALLVSEALPSPISWGWMRPVILLNERAIDAGDDAEAIIAHELAHVAAGDWAKLLLCRVVVAVYWFNPLVWVLSRMAHHLREEAVDDAVLRAELPAPDYAQLLVHTARHNCNASMLAAHGVAPWRGSLERRVKRVLDPRLLRAPVDTRSAVIGALATLCVVAALGTVTLRQKAHAAPASFVTATPAVVSPMVISASSPPDWPRPSKTRRGAPPNDELPSSMKDSSEPEVSVDIDGDASGDFAQNAISAYPKLAEAPRGQLSALERVATPEDLATLWRHGYRDLTPGALAGAVAVGVDDDALSAIEKAGCARLPIGEVQAIVALGVDPDELRGTRCTRKDVNDAIRRRHSNHDSG